MKFLVDAQLPKTLSDFLEWKGHDSVHSSELPMKNSTSDKDLLIQSKTTNRIIVTKDNDFLESYLVNSEPEKPILIKTGNIPNNALLQIFSRNYETIIELITRSNLIEINVANIIEHK